MFLNSHINSRVCIQSVRLAKKPDINVTGHSKYRRLLTGVWRTGMSTVPVSRAEVTGRLSLPDATSAHAREIVGSFGPQ